MSLQTKSNGQKDPLDRFYTPIETVSKCLSELDFSQYDCIIEPSAGTGNFLKQFPSNIAIFAYDLAPKADGIVQQDWFTVDKSQFNNFNKVLVCGNPPFGQQNTLAIQFFNEAAKFCDTIAFILPLSFKKDTIKNSLNLSFRLSKEIDLKNCQFLLKDNEQIAVPCVFQIWEKSTKKREKVRLKTISNLFDFVDKNNADFRIQRVGGNAGKASFDLDRSANSNYFIKNKTNMPNQEFINLINALNFPTIAFTVGPKSLSKGELIAVLEENFPIDFY